MIEQIVASLVSGMTEEWTSRACRAVALYSASLHRADAMRGLVAFGMTIADVGSGLPLLIAIAPRAMMVTRPPASVWADAPL